MALISSAPPSSPSAMNLFLILPETLLETLLLTPTLSARDLSSLRLATSPCSAFATAIETAARLHLQSSPQGRLLLQHRMPNETNLDLLHFFQRCNPTVELTATQVFSCGRNDYGQGARLASTDSNTLLPTFPCASSKGSFVDPAAPVMAIAAGQDHSACISVYGLLQVAGGNRRGQLGLGDTEKREAWTPVEELKANRVAQVACGAGHTVALTGCGKVYCTGANEYGQLGTGDWKDRRLFEEVGHQLVMIAAGSRHTVVLGEDGRVWACGDNSNGQLGGRRGKSRNEMTEVGCFGRRVVRIAAGGDTTMLLTSDNMVLVTGKRTSSLSVIGGLGMSRVTHLSVGEGFAVACTREGACVVSEHRKRFQLLPELEEVEAKGVSAGSGHYVVITSEGEVLASGDNAFGQVAAGEMGLTLQGGEGARVVRPHRVPLSSVSVPQGFRAVQAAAGGFHTLVLVAREDGSM